MIAAKPRLLQAVADAIATATEIELSVGEIRATLIEIFASLFEGSLLSGFRGESSEPFATAKDMIEGYRSAIDAAKIGYLRTAITSELVGEFIHGVRFGPNKRILPLSRVWLDEKVRVKVEILKRFTYEALIMSPRLKVAELRGWQIVESIFSALVAKNGQQLLPEDYQEWFSRSRKSERMRVVCDFVAGMTDGYAVEFYSRLNSATPQSIFKPI